MFRMKSNTFGRKIHTFSEDIFRYLIRFLIINVMVFIDDKLYKTFKHFKYPFYATEALFQQAYKPLGIFARIKTGMWERIAIMDIKPKYISFLEAWFS